jgi:transposase
MAVRRYSREFKVSAVKLVNHQGYTVPQAAESLGVSDQNIRNWVSRLSAEVGKAPIDEPSKLREENHRLRDENRRLRTEREILKKAAAFFARQPT